MIKENIKFCDIVTENIVTELEKKNLGNFFALFPMLRKEDDNLLLGTLIEIEDEELNKKGKITRPKYWVVLDNETLKIKEFNKTEEKDYMETLIIPLDKEFEDNFTKEKKELIKYELDKRTQYTNYLLKDVKDEVINAESNILDAINHTLILDNKEVSAEDYLIANIEEEIKKEVEELIKLVVNNKYSAIIYYYQTLIEDILNEYKKTKNINIKKMKLASTILSKYYGEVYGIKYFFNV